MLIAFDEAYNTYTIRVLKQRIAVLKKKFKKVRVSTLGLIHTRYFVRTILRY